MRIVLLPLLALLAGNVLAGRWVPIVEGPTRAVYLDTAGAVRDGGVIRTWVREVYTQEQRSDQVGVFYYSANSLVSYDCASRTFAPLFRVFYSGDGTELRRVNLDAVETPTLAPPGSLHEGLLERACMPLKPKAEPVKVAVAETMPKPTAVSASAERPADMGNSAISKPVTEAPKALLPRASRLRRRPSRTEHTAQTPATSTNRTAAGCATEIREAARTTQRGRWASRRRTWPLTAAPVAQRQAAAGRRRGKGRAGAREIYWDYEGTGAPDKWGKLKPEYATCANGKRQSPIDIRDGARLALEPIRFDYKPAPLRIVDSGHTVQVNYAEGSSIVVAGERFELMQFHFHKPAEERIDGRAYDMVAHLVHRSLDGRLAVVAVLFEAGEQPNAFIDALWPHLPLEAGREVMPADVAIDINAMLPEARSYYTYMGSLTTPPCSEGVLWLVLKAPVPVSREQVGVFGRLYSMNARPVQPANGRLIKESN
jgi:carbonic anhydrase